MPLIKDGAQPLPAWCELQYYQVLELAAGASHTFTTHHPNQKLIVATGEGELTHAGARHAIAAGANLDLPAGVVQVQAGSGPLTLVYLAGAWGEERGGSGLWAIAQSATPEDKGDPVDYPKTTNFDCHYHDCDEYWILYAGRGIAVSEGKQYEVGPGDCIATGMGHHHDFPQVFEPVKAIFFETTLEGQKRRGHLWNHTHGRAEPKVDRV
jgi:mannose-6-phosphate isomerase-like protein (cupin superfamily)